MNHYRPETTVWQPIVTPPVDLKRGFVFFVDLIHASGSLLVLPKKLKVITFKKLCAFKDAHVRHGHALLVPTNVKSKPKHMWYVN